MMYAYSSKHYYSSLQETITSLCKAAFGSRRRRRLPADRRHTESLKWQQEAFHRMLQLVGLQREGMVSDAEVDAYRSQLLDTLVSLPSEQESVAVAEDKLLFLQELFYAKCISAEDYHCSKRPLLQRLAMQGAEINSQDLIVGAPVGADSEEWSSISLNDDEVPPTKIVAKQRSTPFKFFSSNRGASPQKPWKGKARELGSSNRDTNTILMPESSPLVTKRPEKTKRKPFHSLFQEHESEEKGSKSWKKQWSFEGLKMWKRGNSEDEASTPYLPPGERSDGLSSVACTLTAGAVEEGPEMKRIKKKVLEDNAEILCASMSKKEMAILQISEKEKHGGEEKWVAFEDTDENLQPNLFSLKPRESDWFFL